MDQKQAEYFTTPIKDIPTIVADLRENFYATLPTSIEYRITQLRQLAKLIDENEKELIEACREHFYGDYHRQVLTRLFLIRHDIADAIIHVKKWTKRIDYPQPFPNNIIWKAQGSYHPLGVVCIIAPWNFPIQLLLRPLVGAIAAGNAAVLKPSEITDSVARLLYKLVPKYLDNKMIKVVCGGPDETNTLLSQKLDYVLFTGSTNIGKVVMKKCSENLIPCCLELGGKNPVLLDDNVSDDNLKKCLKRIVYSRLENGGQVCLCPEYIFCSKNKQDQIIDIIRDIIKTFFGDCKNNSDYCHIVNDLHFQRVKKLRDHYINQHPEKIAIGSKKNDLDKFINLDEDDKTRYLPPLVLKNIDFHKDKIMENEIFGPILSIIPMDGNNIYEWKQKAYQLIRSQSKPLACYIYSSDKNLINDVNQQIQAGAIVANMCIMHLTLKDVPFGGVGESGMNHYGGQQSFQLFSQLKPLSVRSYGLEFINEQQYPGLNKSFEKLSKQVNKLIPKEHSIAYVITKNAIAIGAIASLGWYIKQKYIDK